MPASFDLVEIDRHGPCERRRSTSSASGSTPLAPYHATLTGRVGEG